jgi:hypothetical protein
MMSGQDEQDFQDDRDADRLCILLILSGLSLYEFGKIP